MTDVLCPRAVALEGNLHGESPLFPSGMALLWKAEATVAKAPVDIRPIRTRTASVAVAPKARPVLLRPRTWTEQWLGLVAYWVSSRVVMLALLRKGRGDIAREVHSLYRHWGHLLAHGSYPVGDVTWQYPPGAGLVMVAPKLLPFLSYLQAFVVLVLIADALTTAALLRAGSGGPARSLAGAWFWVLGLPLMMQLAYARFDVLVTAVAVLGLLALPRHPRVGGALVGLAAIIKVWPVLTVLGTPRGRTSREAWLAVLASAAALSLLLATVFRGAFGFLSEQSRRGIEVESFGGTALQLAKLLGWSGHATTRYGSVEYVGPYVGTVSALAVLLTALSFAWLLLWRLKARRWTGATPYDAALTAVLLFTVTSRVISPQYMIWLIGLSAVCLTVRGTTQRPVAGLLLLATGVTTVDYPVFFSSVTHSTWHGFAVMALRNGLLLAAALLSCVRLWRASAVALRAADSTPVVERAA